MVPKLTKTFSLIDSTSLQYKYELNTTKMELIADNTILFTSKLFESVLSKDKKLYSIV
jgi:hypothetical protein